MEMTENIRPDYLFEVSWEVCNKVGGIYTVISTKALSIVKELKDNYILIGPDVWNETTTHPEFIEDRFLFRSWREHAESSGLKFKIGRWNISGKPIAILVDFRPYFASKDKIFAHLWEKVQLDSLSGQWDYIEPAMFGFAAAKVIHSFYDYNISSSDKIIAQFHEWMTGLGILFLKGHVPQVGTVLTTHATVVGRSIAGSNLNLYSDFEFYNGDTMARSLGVMAKHSLEKTAAAKSDCFTTVSEITARECKQFLMKPVDVITPNGFEDTFVPSPDEFDKKREIARSKIINVTSALLNQEIPDNTIFLLNSGRYEFHNKGIDLYIDALGKLNRDNELKENIVAYIMVPANHGGPVADLIERIKSPDYNKPLSEEFLTHILHEYETDSVIRRIKENGLKNSKDDKVKIIFTPCYLDSKDGIFDMNYYDLLIGFDLTIFPSYYEPWGYTPMESIAFKIPTVTTSLAGFGMWINKSSEINNESVDVIFRDDENSNMVVAGIADFILNYSNKTVDEKIALRQNAYDVSRSVLWQNLAEYYKKAYEIALLKVNERADLFKGKQTQDHTVFKDIVRKKPSWKKILISPNVPEKFRALKELSKNLWWTWNHDAVELFKMMNKPLWISTSHNPIAMLEALTLEDFNKLEKDKVFMEKLELVHHKFITYMERASQKPQDKTAYFSMEFGIHDSLKIYSGGLGILAGDYLKEASDSNANIIGVGLLYRYGYFKQNISLLGNQIETYPPQKYSHLPLMPVRYNDADGETDDNWVKIKIALPGRTLLAKAWRVDVGTIPLYLLETDIKENSPEDRAITHKLYGGDNELRFKQELVLGVGGIRLLDTIGIKPTIYHCNEGHAAFIGVERIRKYVQDDKLSFYQAIEVVRASQLFTTHTPVPAGHDTFSEDILRTYIAHYPERMNLTWDAFMNLGKIYENDPVEKFSMSVLASKLSSEINGVSRIHGRVTREMFSELYNGYFTEELHIGYVTNGVHFPTWVAAPWKKLYDEVFDNKYYYDQSNREYWQRIQEVDDRDVWNIRNELRARLVDRITKRLEKEMTSRQENPKLFFKIKQTISSKKLTIGFARRFATYKRANLLFMNLERLSKIVNNEKFPVQFIFAGKAHPNDNAGQDLIKMIYDVAHRPEFLGKIIILENYDIQLAKYLVQGVDIWLNTPTRPLEASGTSGEKAIMNGVVNFSVLDGWWAEGYKPEAGWSLKEERTYLNQDIQDELDAETIYNIFEDEIIPTFYELNSNGLPEKWISYVKNTISEIAPDFTMRRMLLDYQEKYYKKLTERAKLFYENNYEQACVLAAWKQKLLRGWDSIEVFYYNVTQCEKRPLALGEFFNAEIVLDMNELSGTDIGIEIIFARTIDGKLKEIIYKEEMQMTDIENTHVTFKCTIPADRVGVFDYAFRVFPKSPLLAHRQDFNLVEWL